MGSVDTNAVRLILQVLDLDQWREDMPRLLRGALGRQRDGCLGSDGCECVGNAGSRKVLPLV